MQPFIYAKEFNLYTSGICSERTLYTLNFIPSFDPEEISMFLLMAKIRPEGLNRLMPLINNFLQGVLPLPGSYSFQIFHDQDWYSEFFSLFQFLIHMVLVHALVARFLVV